MSKFTDLVKAEQDRLAKNHTMAAADADRRNAAHRTTLESVMSSLTACLSDLHGKRDVYVDSYMVNWGGSQYPILTLGRIQIHTPTGFRKTWFSRKPCAWQCLNIDATVDIFNQPGVPVIGLSAHCLKSLGPGCRLDVDRDSSKTILTIDRSILPSGTAVCSVMSVDDAIRMTAAFVAAFLPP
jgi:hypothetical protein